MKNLLLLVPICVASFIAWLFWGPVLGFLLSLIPTTATYTWVSKLFCVVLVGYFGGIGIPIFILIFGLMITIAVIGY